MKKTLFIAMAIFAATIISFAAFTSDNQTSAAEFAAKFAQTKDAKLTAEEMTGTYNFDRAHSSIGFRIKHMGLAEIPGSFTDYNGTINVNGADLTKSSVEFTAKVTSINTGVEARDKHLRTADFFEVEKYPDMTFKSSKIEKKGENSYVATGDFTLKGVTKQIQLPVTINGFLKDQRGNIKAGVSIETMINRRDYGINYGGNLPNGVPTLSDDVKINLQIEAAKAAPQPAATTK